MEWSSQGLSLIHISDAPIRTPKRRVRRAANPTGLLLLTTFIHLLLLVQSCFSGGQFSALPVLPFVLVTVIEWGMFFYSTRGLNHVSFELETIGFLLSGIGIMLLSGTRAALPEGAEAPGPMDIFNFSLMKTTYMQVITLLLGVLIFCFLIWFMNDLERVMTVSYTHLDVYKRQVQTWKRRKKWLRRRRSGTCSRACCACRINIKLCCISII